MTFSFMFSRMNNEFVAFGRGFQNVVYSVFKPNFLKLIKHLIDQKSVINRLFQGSPKKAVK